MVAVGSLYKVWLEIPEDVGAGELKDVFRSYFGAEWVDVLNAVDNSIQYNAANNTYFAVRDLRPVHNLTLEQVLKEKGISQPPNIPVTFPLISAYAPGDSAQIHRFRYPIPRRYNKPHIQGRRMAPTYHRNGTEAVDHPFSESFSGQGSSPALPPPHRGQKNR